MKRTIVTTVFPELEVLPTLESQTGVVWMLEYELFLPTLGDLPGVRLIEARGLTNTGWLPYSAKKLDRDRLVKFEYLCSADALAFTNEVKKQSKAYFERLRRSYDTKGR